MIVHYNCEKCKEHLCIHKVPIFSSLDSEDLRKIMKLITHDEYKKGETIVFEQEVMDSVIIINEGSAKAYKTTADGREQILYVFSEGDSLGAELFTGQPSTYTVEGQPVKICKLSRNQFQELYMLSDIASLIVELGGRLSRLENAIQSIGVRMWTTVSFFAAGIC